MVAQKAAAAPPGDEGRRGHGVQTSQGGHSEYSENPSARQVIAALPRGRWFGSYGLACCPAHNDRNPSLSVRDGDKGRLLVRCYSGCDSVEVLRVLNDLNPATGPASETSASRKQGGDKQHYALEIWRESKPAEKSVVAKYLKRRGITVSVPPSLRFHPGLKHGPAGLVFPAMVAAVQAPDRKVVAIHRTFLTDFAAKAGVSDPKLSLGPQGKGAIRLALASETLGLAEGIETALSAMQATGIPTWATISASRMSRIEVPPEVRRVIIFADAGEAGEQAAQQAAKVFHRQGRHVEIARPRNGCGDFNDVLAGESAA